MMEEKFVQKTVYLDSSKSSGKLKVEKLWTLMNNHPYSDQMYKALDIEKIKSEIITIDFIDTVFERVEYFNKSYRKHSIRAEIKHIDLYQDESIVHGKLENSIMFHFDEYVVVDEIKNNLTAIAKYDSKNTYLDQYVMTKYANHLYKKGFGALARENVQYFKDLAARSDNYNKHKSYRLVEHEGKNYLRGITSIGQYYEYGVEFAFVAAMLVLHKFMKEHKGTEYEIKNAALNESKLEIFVSEKHKKDAGEFGQVSTAIKISTNDLGQGSLNFQNIIKVGKENVHGIYLFPPKNFNNTRVNINHTTKPENVISALNNMDSVLNTSDKFIEELMDLKTIKTPDELRMKIRLRIEAPRSVFKGLTHLSEIFKKVIDNDITNFGKLLEMCNKAEELEMNYDLKDKLRYIISDIILNGKTNN